MPKLELSCPFSPPFGLSSQYCPLSHTGSDRQAEQTVEEWGQASAFRLTEEVVGWHGGSQSEMRRMRAGPVVPVGKPREAGKGQQAQARRNHRGSRFHLRTDARRAGEELFGCVVMRRGRHDNVQ